MNSATQLLDRIVLKLRLCSEVVKLYLDDRCFHSRLVNSSQQDEDQMEYLPILKDMI